MNKHAIFTAIVAATMFQASSRAQQIPTAGNNGAAVKIQDFTPSAEARTMLEHGRKGSRTRPAARTFSGQPVFPVAPFGQAKQGAPAAQPSASPENSVTTMEINSARFAKFETAAATPAAQPNAGVSTGALATKSSAVSSTVTANPIRVPLAQMESPVDGSVLLPTQTFVWTTGSGVEEYYLWMGSCFECNDLLDENEGQNLSRGVTLPVDGRLVYVTLFSYIGGNWVWVDYQYQASQGGNAFPAQMTSPANGATLASQQTFVWNAGYGVADFYLRIGSCQGCYDLLDEDQGQNLRRTVNIPVDGRTIFVRLFSYIGGTWYYYDYQYRASLIQSTQHVRVNIVNQLAYPVNVAINGNLVGSCPALTTAGVDVNVSVLTVSFELNQPTINGRTLGDEMSGIFDTITNPSGTINFQVTNHVGSTYYFEPQITNRTANALEIEVNGGLQAENRCNCTAPAGGTKISTGYYLFYTNSNVRLYRDGNNYTGPYTYFGINDGSGTPITVSGTAAQVELVD